MIYGRQRLFEQQKSLAAHQGRGLDRTGGTATAGLIPRT